MHAAPFATFAMHCLLVVLQYAFDAQSMSVAQLVVHPPFAQPNGAHITVCVEHVPAPSQSAPCATAPLHVLAPQTVPGG
jgi:hypothetical protein